jgi:hypothetical protein
MNRVPLLKKSISKFFWTGYTAWHGRDEKAFPYKPPEELYRHQNRRLKAIVAFAYETVLLSKLYSVQGILQVQIMRTPQNTPPFMAGMNAARG